MPVLDLLARYSPEFPCLLQQLTDLTPKINQVLHPDTGIQIAAQIVQNRGPYRPSDSPAYADKRGPRCYIINGTAPQYPPGGPFADGSAAPPASKNSAAIDGTSPTGAGGTVATGAPAAAPLAGTTTQGQGAAKIDAANIGLPNTPNSPEERTLVTTLTGMQMGLRPGEVPAFAPYLSAATMRGTTVAIS